MATIDLKRIFKNREALRNVLLATRTTNSHTIELVSGDEGLGNAYFFQLDKSAAISPAEALAILLNVELHFYEEWQISETNEENIDLVIDNWLLKNADHLKLLDVPADTALADVAEIANSIIRHLALQGGSRPGRGGIYIDKAKTEDLPTALLASSASVVLGNFSRWNEREVFYDTPSHYVLFSWSTSA